MRQCGLGKYNTYKSSYKEYNQIQSLKKLQKFILEERSREFAFEGRWYDVTGMQRERIMLTSVICARWFQVQFCKLKSTAQAKL